ncbi:MAG: di-heme oxidoredictase family protein [Planctomycetota bacterium]
MSARRLPGATLVASGAFVALAVLATAGWLVAAPGAPAPGATQAAIPGDGATDQPILPVGTLGGPVHALSPAEEATFRAGRALFDRSFHRSHGLGAPEFNADSCRACHQDPVLGGSGDLDLNVSRAGNDNGGSGPFADITGGQIFSKLRGPFAPGREEYVVAEADVFEQRQTPPLFGAGLIDAIPEVEIQSNEDPTDSDMDGVFGVARVVMVNGLPEVGRFGWKAQIPRLDDFSRDGLANELGITAPDDGRGFALVSDADPVSDPEVSPAEVSDLTAFIALLAPPPRGGAGNDPIVLEGETLFDTVGCAKCHKPTLQGPTGPVPLYSNLLLHDVHPASFRGMAEPGAPSGMYRTPPLWGISKTAPYLHDGRAETLEAAILGHDGEALLVRQAYEALIPSEKTALLAFLADL